MLTISPVPAFTDNYLWLLERPGYDGCAIVDPGDAAPVIASVQQKNLRLDAILITHKHADHIGGVRQLKNTWPAARVYGPQHEPIHELETRLDDGDQITLEGLQAHFATLAVAGHTEGHIAYFGSGILFCGDTLFGGGCGRVFSGTHVQLSQALQRLAKLPGATLVYCAHEYTMANLGFARWVEPDNPALRERIARDAARRECDQPTLPTTIAMELATNPFMRTDQDTVIRAAQRWAGQELSDRDAVFRALRDWKDRDYD